MRGLSVEVGKRLALWKKLREERIGACHCSEAKRSRHCIIALKNFLLDRFVASRSSAMTKRSLPLAPRVNMVFDARRRGCGNFGHSLRSRSVAAARQPAFP